MHWTLALGARGPVYGNAPAEPAKPAPPPIILQMEQSSALECLQQDGASAAEALRSRQPYGPGREWNLLPQCPDKSWVASQTGYINLAMMAM